ncbi:MAG: ArsR family transcriptional regulator [Candidatus Nanoarchaeia archaeon]|nr:ArsR family transcriptional regulator [Candidatus Nanoarchaeia archaeon]
MDIGTLFTEQRWNILRNLAFEKTCPLDLSKKTNTTMANISQQLRLLEASDIVKKEKISNRDKGKPRTLFSLSNDYAYIISAMEGFAEKKLKKLDKFNQILFRAWFIDSPELEYFTKKFIWTIENAVDDIDFIALRDYGSQARVLIASKKPDSVQKKVKDSVIKKYDNSSKDFKIDVVSNESAEKLVKQGKGIFSSLNEAYVLYDSLMLTAKYGKRGGS